MTRKVLAGDLGGTHLRFAVVDASGSVVSQVAKWRVPHAVSPDGLIELVRTMADEFSGHTFDAVALTAPAPAAKDFDGVLTKLPNLPSVTGMNLKTQLAKVFDLPITVENDANAAAIGEAWVGATRGMGNSICVTLGTGIGGGLILNGEPYRGPDGSAGELGHFTVEPDGPLCKCGSHGCVELYASATAIVRMAAENGLTRETAEDVYKAWQNGDERASAVFTSMGRYLGIVLAGLINTLNPDAIVICGGASGAWDAFIPSLEAEIHERAYPAPVARSRIVRGELGDTAGIIGVARSAFLSL
ncbi:MAG: ROK family protein [Pyrinomonadaceae bacterium]|nr:ROK family protein [Pyrinomonadaceae bacterium]